MLTKGAPRICPTTKYHANYVTPIRKCMAQNNPAAPDWRDGVRTGLILYRLLA